MDCQIDGSTWRSGVSEKQRAGERKCSLGNEKKSAGKSDTINNNSTDQ